MIGEVFYKINRDSRSGDFKDHPFLTFIVRGVEKTFICVRDENTKNYHKKYFHRLVLNITHIYNPIEIFVNGSDKEIHINLGGMLIPEEYGKVRQILKDKGYYQKDDVELKQKYIDLCILHTENLEDRNKALIKEIEENKITIKNLQNEIL